jgi:hypothetical protein
MNAVGVMLVSTICLAFEKWYFELIAAKIMNKQSLKRASDDTSV